MAVIITFAVAAVLARAMVLASDEIRRFALVPAVPLREVGSASPLIGRSVLLYVHARGDSRNLVL